MHDWTRPPPRRSARAAQPGSAQPQASASNRMATIDAEQIADLIRETRGGGPSAAGPSVNAQSALTLGTAYGCVRVLSQTLAALPIRLTDERTGEEITDHPVRRLFRRRFSDRLAAFQARQAIAAAIALRGNAYCLRIPQIGRGEMLDFLPPDQMRVEVEESGALTYLRRVPGQRGEVRIPSERIWHVRGLTVDGVMGLSVLEAARQAMGLGLAEQKHAAKFYRTGGQVSGVLEVGEEFQPSEEQWATLTDDVAHEFGPNSTSSVKLLQKGLAYKSVSMKNTDAQFLESRHFSVVDICRFFGVPPHMVYETEQGMPRSNVEQLGLEFAIYTLTPLTIALAQSIEETLLTRAERDRIEVSFDLDGLARADFRTRMDGLRIAVGRPWLTPNEARAADGRQPIDNGDELYVPANMIDPGGDAGPEDRNDAR